MTAAGTSSMISTDRKSGNLRVGFGIALLYVLGAQLGALFALTPYSLATLFWPPSGIALAGLLLYGNRALSGIFIGAFASNLVELSASPQFIVVVSSIVISLGSTLSAKAAALLLRRYATSAPIYGCSIDILKGSLLIAAACSIAAFVGVACLFANGLIVWKSVPITFAMWWLGNFCGMQAVTPLLYASVRRFDKRVVHGSPPTGPRGPTALNALFSIGAILGFAFLWQQESAGISAALEREALVGADSIQRTMQRAGRDIKSVEALVSASEEHLDASEFLRYTEALHLGSPGHPIIVSVGWAPAIEDIEAWERTMDSFGYSDIRVFERDRGGERQPAGVRKDYYPLQYIYSPVGINKGHLGYDLGSDPSSRQAIERASTSGEVGIIAPIWVSHAGVLKDPALQICAAVFREAPHVTVVAKDRRLLLGAACGVYRMQDILKLALLSTLPGIDLHIFEAAEIGEGDWHYSHVPGADGVSAKKPTAPNVIELARGPHGTADIAFGDSQWRVFAVPGRNFEDQFRSLVPWGALILLLALGVGLSSVLMERIFARRNIKAEMGKTLDALHKARAANEAKTYFMAAASHDIKQPLYALSILADTLLLSSPLKETLPLIASLKTSIAEMSAHFDALMDVGRFQDGSFEIHARDFQLEELSRRIDKEIGPLCQEKGLQWLLDFEDCAAHSDPELVLRLIRNLLINATRFTTEGAVSCIAARVDGRLRFSIMDTGPGLSQAQKELIFSAVVRLRGDTIHTSGLGLGLSIVNKISRSLDLDLSLKSTEGVGTEYVFFVPLALGEGPADA